MNRGPAKNDDLHGNVPENSSVALLLIDVINDLDFEGPSRWSSRPCRWPAASRR